jgi:DNA polymerase-3 subunit epsilon
MKLNRPLAFFDLEATGTDVAKDRIVSIAILKLFPDGSTEIKKRLINPDMKMTDEVIAIHGITNEMVADQPKFRELAKSLYEFLHNCDLAGFNSNNFDIPMLSEEFLRCDMDYPLPGTHFIDAGNIFKKKEERTLSAAFKFYCGQEHTNAHDAEADVLVTWEVLKGQMARYSDLPDTVEELAKFSAFDNRVDLAGKIVKDEAGNYLYNFGPKKGTPVKDDTGLAYWMLGKDFTLNTKRVVERILEEIHTDNQSVFI